MAPLFTSTNANGKSKPPIQQNVINVNVVNIKIQPVIQATSTSDKSALAHNHDESYKGFLIETIVPFMLAGCGMVAAGVLLEKATKWVFLSEVPQTMILVPALLGLKGNLEMTLASRLSTMANMGLLDERKQQVNVFVSNIALIQAQAIVVSLVAAAIAIISGGIHDPILMLCLTLATVLTASAASFVLGSLMVFISILARKKGINPDNIATPVAGATGDVTTLIFLILFGTFFYEHRHFVVLNGVILGSMLLSSLWWMWVASRQQTTLQVLKYGWFAVLLAMLISSGGGYIMERAVEAYSNIPVFQPVINGVGGNLVAVQASKISTYFHQFGKKGMLPANRLITYLNPFRTFACKEKESIQAWVLLGMALPGHIIFGALIFLVQSNSIRFHILFFAFYLAIALIQVSLLLYICQWLSRAIWLLKCNPDNNAIPLLTAMGDLLGTLLLAAAFTFYDLAGGPKLDVERSHIESKNLHNMTYSTTFAPNATFSPHH